MATDFETTLTAAGNKNPTALLQAQEKRGIYVLADNESSLANSFGNVLYLAFQGRVFRFDATDATTVHDGVTCLVTSDGKRFKADAFGGSLARMFVVQSKSLSVPPTSPTVGQSWIVATGGSGAWAGKDKYVAAYTARGWQFQVPSLFDIAMVVGETLYYYFADSNVWVSGLPAMTIGGSSISPSAIRYSRFGLTVANQTTNTPPASPTDGDAYIIGPSPTGSWVGLARSVAIWEVSAWVIYTPYNGASVFDASLGATVKYNIATATWQSLSGLAQINLGAKASGVVTISGASNTSQYCPGFNSPTIGNTTALASIAHTAKRAGAALKVTIICDYYQVDSDSIMSMALFVDAGSAGVDGMRVVGNYQLGTGTPASSGGERSFYLVSSDTNSHTYSVRASAYTPLHNLVVCFAANPRMIIEELA